MPTRPASGHVNNNGIIDNRRRGLGIPRPHLSSFHRAVRSREDQDLSSPPDIVSCGLSERDLVGGAEIRLYFQYTYISEEDNQPRGEKGEEGGRGAEEDYA